MKAVTVVDYGLGNLFNLVTALRAVGADVRVTEDPSLIESADRLILPGVGAFGPGMDMLRAKSLEDPIRCFRESARPLLGICLGMQFLLDESEENGLHRGLGFIPGRVVRFRPESAGCKVPQISWNTLVECGDAARAWDDSVLRGIPRGVAMYFVHSYYVETDDFHDTVACADYCSQRYSSVIGKENVWGVQFHPERSAGDGLKLLDNFLRF